MSFISRQYSWDYRHEHERRKYYAASPLPNKLNKVPTHVIVYTNTQHRTKRSNELKRPGKLKCSNKLKHPGKLKLSYKLKRPGKPKRSNKLKHLGKLKLFS